LPIWAESVAAVVLLRLLADVPVLPPTTASTGLARLLSARGLDRARAELEALFGTKVYLDLRVKVAKDWQRDPRQLSRLGF
jgi:hypothetical protein